MSVSAYKYEQEIWSLQRELIHTLLKKVKLELEKSEKITDDAEIVGSRPNEALVKMI